MMRYCISKNRLIVFSVILFTASVISFTQAQKLYTTSSGEWIFQSGILEQNGEKVNTNMRFTLWFHAGEYLHFDLGNYFGLFTGLAIRNVGFITDENEVTTKYRSYNLGIPLALKLGSFKDKIFVFGGGEYEWMFHFKQKTFNDGVKSKHAEWFSDRTPSFVPSVFAGLQFPHGIHLKFKYYLHDFLNHTYHSQSNFSDYTGFTKTQLWYISLSFQVMNSKLKKTETITEEVAVR